MGELLPHGYDEDVPRGNRRQACHEDKGHHLEAVEDHGEKKMGPEEARPHRVPGMETGRLRRPLHGGCKNVLAEEGNQQGKTSPQGASHTSRLLPSEGLNSTCSNRPVPNGMLGGVRGANSPYSIFSSLYPFVSF